MKRHYEDLSLIVQKTYGQYVGCEKCKLFLKENNRQGFNRHAMSCIETLKLMFEDYPSLVSTYIFQEDKEQMKTLAQWKIQHLKEYINLKSDDVGTINILEQVIKTSQVCSNPAFFPSKKGIYIIIGYFEEKQLVLYVGQSKNIRSRWLQHHKHIEIETLKRVGFSIEWRYIVENNMMTFSDTLERLESQLIAKLQPCLNNKGK